MNRARHCYNQWAEFRRRRRRYKNFAYGNQWGDTVTGPDGRIRTEGEVATLRGRTPLTNNMIRPLIKTITGRFRAEYAHDEAQSETAELDARTFEEFLISGMAVQRIDQTNGTIVAVNPGRFFTSRLADPLGRDVELLGMLHDLSLTETLIRFADGDRRRVREIKRLYGRDETDGPMFSPPGLDFSFGEPGRCRVIEVWTLEGTESTAKKWEMRLEWKGRWLTPDGVVLKEVTAKCHPFAFRAYPLIDGEIHSFVEDVIDQQKYINRMVTHVDNMMSTSAKGVLLFPQDQLSDGMEWTDVADCWTSYDGIIPYNPRPGEPEPRQVVSSGVPAGAFEQLSLQMRMMEEVSGVSPALRGRQSGANSAQLYEAQVKTSSAALTDLFLTFKAFLRIRDGKLAISN